MMALPGRLIALLTAVSGALPLAVALLSSGIGAKSALLVAGGVIVGSAGLIGLVALARAVFVLERRRASR